MGGYTRKYMQRFMAIATIVIGAKITSDGFTVLKTAGVTGKPDPVEAILLGFAGVILGCLLMALTYVEKKKNSKKKGGRK